MIPLSKGSWFRQYVRHSHLTLVLARPGGALAISAQKACCSVLLPLIMRRGFIEGES